MLHEDNEEVALKIVDGLLWPLDFNGGLMAGLADVVRGGRRLWRQRPIHGLAEEEEQETMGLMFLSGTDVNLRGYGSAEEL